jgi:hypothetical protein
MTGKTAIRRWISSMQKSQRNFNLINVLIVLAIGLVPICVIDFAFTGFAILCYLTGTIWLFAISVGVRRGRRAFFLACIPAVLCMIPIVPMLPAVFPTYLATIDGGHFKEQSLISVLAHIAQQKQKSPRWQFCITDKTLAHAPINVEIPDGCRLGNALQLAADAAGCDWDWQWRYGLAVFCFRPRGTTPKLSLKTAVIVSCDRVWEAEELE